MAAVKSFAEDTHSTLLDTRKDAATRHTTMMETIKLLRRHEELAMAVRAAITSADFSGFKG